MAKASRTSRRDHRQSDPRPGAGRVDRDILNPQPACEASRESPRPADVSLAPPLKRQIDFISAPIAVSSDFHRLATPLIGDAGALKVEGDNAILYLWYDNEFGYSCQVARVAARPGWGSAPDVLRWRSDPEQSRVGGVREGRWAASRTASPAPDQDARPSTELGSAVGAVMAVPTTMLSLDAHASASAAGAAARSSVTIGTRRGGEFKDAAVGRGLPREPGDGRTGSWTPGRRPARRPPGPPEGSTSAMTWAPAAWTAATRSAKVLPSGRPGGWRRPAPRRRLGSTRRGQTSDAPSVRRSTAPASPPFDHRATRWTCTAAARRRARAASRTSLGQPPRPHLGGAARAGRGVRAGAWPSPSPSPLALGPRS